MANGIATMFKSQVVATVVSLLKERCKDGGVCKREDIHSVLAEKFDLPGGEYQDALIRAAVEGGAFNHGETQYANFKGGRGGCAAGVREVDVAALKHDEAVADKRRENMAKARAARLAKLADKPAPTVAKDPAAIKAVRQANAAKAREARMAKRAAAAPVAAVA